MEGTYPLPKRNSTVSCFNVVINYLAEDDEVTVVQQRRATRAED